MPTLHTGDARLRVRSAKQNNFRRGIRVVVAVAGIRMKMVGWMIVIMAWKADHVKWRRVESNQEWQ